MSRIPPSPPTRGNPTHSYEKSQEKLNLEHFNLIFVKHLIQKIILNHYMRFNLNNLNILEH